MKTYIIVIILDNAITRIHTFEVTTNNIVSANTAAMKYLARFHTSIICVAIAITEKGKNNV